MTQETDQLDYLFERYGPHLNTEELARVFKYSDNKSVLEAIRRKTFPVKTFRIRRIRVADVRDVAAYLENQRQIDS